MVDQHRILWQDTDRACMAAEKRAAELEAQLDKLHDEFADRSTTSEARERNRQWIEAVERVQVLERELQLAQQQQPDEDESTPRMKVTALLPPESNEEEVEVLERLLTAVDRLRAERDQLRRDAAFLRAEAKAIENAVDATVEEHRRMDLQRVKVVEEELEGVKAVVLKKDARIAQLTTASTREQQQAGYVKKAVEALAITIQRYDLTAHRSSVINSVLTVPTAPLLNTDHSMHSFTPQWPSQPLTEQSSGSWLAESALQQPMQFNRAFAVHEDASSFANEDEDQCMAFNFDPQPAHNPSPPRAQAYASSGAAAKYIEELELRVDRRTEQIGIHQHEIRRLQTNLQIAEEAIDSMRAELEVLGSERACLEEDAHRVRESWAFDKQALEKIDAELDEAKGELERQGEELLARDGEMVEVLKTLFEGISKSRVAITMVGRLQDEMRATRLAMEEQAQQAQSCEREARRLSGMNRLAKADAHGRERELEETVGRLKSQVEELDEQLNDARDSLKTSEALVIHLESRLQVEEAAHKDALSSHEQTVEALNARLVEAGSTTAAASDARKAAEEANVVLLGEIGELKVALEDAQDNHATRELEERLVSEEKYRVELKGLLEAEKEGAIVLQAEVRRLNEEVERQSGLDQELDEMVAILDHERQAYSLLEDEFNTLERKHAVLSEKLKETQARLEQCNAELTEKRAALEAAESRYVV
jgi:chromosome segregation ATPase